MSVTQPQVEPPIDELVVHLQGPYEVSHGLFETSRLITDEAEIGVDDQRQWLEFKRARLAGQGLVESALSREQHRAVPVMRHGVMRIEFDGAFEFALAFFPIPIKPDQRGGQ